MNRDMSGRFQKAPQPSRVPPIPQQVRESTTQRVLNVLVPAVGFVAVAFFWQWRHVILVVAFFYGAFIFMRWLWRYHPYWAVFIISFCRGLFGGRR